MQDEKFIEKVECEGDIPLPKFGHTCCLISRDKLIIFGGASGEKGDYMITNDTFLLTMQESPPSFIWSRLESISLF